MIGFFLGGFFFPVGCPPIRLKLNCCMVSFLSSMYHLNIIYVAQHSAFERHRLANFRPIFVKYESHGDLKFSILSICVEL